MLLSYLMPFLLGDACKIKYAIPYIANSTVTVLQIVKLLLDVHEPQNSIGFFTLPDDIAESTCMTFREVSSFMTELKYLASVCLFAGYYRCHFLHESNF